MLSFAEVEVADLLSWTKSQSPRTDGERCGGVTSSHVKDSTATPHL